VEEPDLDRLAAFLAEHAILLLAVGSAACCLGAGAAVLAIRIAVALRSTAGRGWAVVRSWLPNPVRRAAGAPVSGRLPLPALLLALFLGLTIIAGAVVFIVIAEQTAAGAQIASFDLIFSRALRQQGTPGWDLWFGWLTMLGSGYVLIPASAALTVAAWRRRGRATAIVWAFAQGGSAILTWTLKQTYTRTRPEFASAALVDGWSFPSGHAMGTFVFCGFGVYLLARHARSWTTAAVLGPVAMAWCLAMGFSRLYLGVHYASDVAAGVVAGLAWVAVCIAVHEWSTAGARRPKN
jgi:undecaprenyl-diphosphatase